MAKYISALLVLLTGSFAWGQHSTEPAGLLKRETQLLKQLSHKPATTVPDAVLNRTQCVVIIPAGTKRLRQGAAACRETADEWKLDALVALEQKLGPRRGADLLIFILSDNAVKALQSGSLEVETTKYPIAPLAPKNAIPSEHELSAAVFTYEYADGRLSGRKVQGTVRRKTGGEKTTDEALESVSKKDTEHFLSSLTAFFNTIVPAGIVIHHTAVLPDEDAPPRNEHAVDKYHSTRGFEITCSGHIYHVAYHYVILANGRVQSGRPDTCEGAHAKGYNSYLGIAVVGDFDSKDNPKGEKGPVKPSEKQIASLVRLCHRLMLRYHIGASHVVRHSDVAATRCPGDRFPFTSFLRQLKSSRLKRAR